MREHVLLGFIDGLGDAGAAVLAEPACHIGRIAGWDNVGLLVGRGDRE